MVPVFSFILGIIGCGLDMILGTPYVFQCLGVLFGYVIWIRMRCSAVAKGTVAYNSGTVIHILLITWCAVFFSGAPKIGMGRESDISETGFYIWSTVALLISAVSIWFHQRETYQPHKHSSKPERETYQPRKHSSKPERETYQPRKHSSKPASKKIQIRCPDCNRKLKGATENMVGEIGVCPKCKAEFEIKKQ